MKTYIRICNKDFAQRDSEGTLFELKRGKEYVTSEEEDGKVIVFSNFWVEVPVDLFDKRPEVKMEEKIKLLKDLLNKAMFVLEHFTET
jgi:hypothetical protein